MLVHSHGFSVSVSVVANQVASVLTLLPFFFVRRQQMQAFAIPHKSKYGPLSGSSTGAVQDYWVVGGS